MINLVDIMRQAQSGTALPSLSRQFGLDGPQTQSALDALLPAFSLAFQRNAQNPNAFAALTELMTSGRSAPFFDGSARPFAPGGAAGGQDVLAALFGSEAVTRQVATQAAKASGVGVQVLQEMMPVVAATLVGGMFRYASIEGFADLLRTWSDALRAAARPSPPPRSSQAWGPWSGWFDMMSAMGGGAPAAPAPPAPGAGSDPFQAWAKMMGALADPSAAPPPPPPAPARPNPFEAVTNMFDAGREAQAQHLEALRSILEGSGGTGRPG